MQILLLIICLSLHSSDNALSPRTVATPKKPDVILHIPHTHHKHHHAKHHKHHHDKCDPKRIAAIAAIVTSTGGAITGLVALILHYLNKDV